MSGADLDLSVTRLIDAPVTAVWRAWTDHLGEWWCPRPWRAEVVAQELHAGGRFATTMHGPAGERSELEGVILEVVPGQRVVFTNAYRAGWVPQEPFMTGILEFEPEGEGTRFRGTSRHWSADTRAQHEAMGFHDGWSRMAEQLEEVATRIAASDQ